MNNDNGKHEYIIHVVNAERKMMKIVMYIEKMFNKNFC